MKNKTVHKIADEEVLEYPIFTENGYEYTCCNFIKISTFLLANKFVYKIICNKNTEKLIYSSYRTTKHYKKATIIEYINSGLFGKIHNCPIYEGKMSDLCVKIIWELGGK